MAGTGTLDKLVPVDNTVVRSVTNLCERRSRSEDANSGYYSAPSSIAQSSQKTTKKFAGPHLPFDLWHVVLDKLRLVDLTAPLALTCKSFLRHAQKRLAQSQHAARNLQLLQTFALSPNHMHPRVADNLLFTVSCSSGAQALEAWDLWKGELDSRLDLPPPLCHEDIDDLVITKDAKHVALVLWQNVFLVHYDRALKRFAMKQCYEFGNVERDFPQGSSYADALLARFSSSSNSICIAHFHIELDRNPKLVLRVHQETLKSPRRVDAANENGTVVVPSSQMGMICLDAEYDLEDLDLHGVQMSASPFHVLIPPHRIAESGFVVDCSRRSGHIRKRIDGLHDYQLLGFSPNGQHLLETRGKRFGPDSSVEILLTATSDQGSPNWYGDGNNNAHRKMAKLAASNRDERHSRSSFMVRDGEVVSAQFSGDSGSVAVLLGRETCTLRPEGQGDGVEREGVHSVAGWWLMRTSDGSIVSRCGLAGSSEGSAEKTEISSWRGRRCTCGCQCVGDGGWSYNGDAGSSMCGRCRIEGDACQAGGGGMQATRLRASYKTSLDGSVLYGYSSHREWVAWDMYTGMRLWSSLWGSGRGCGGGGCVNNEADNCGDGASQSEPAHRPPSEVDEDSIVHVQEVEGVLTEADPGEYEEIEDWREEEEEEDDGDEEADGMLVYPIDGGFLSVRILVDEGGYEFEVYGDPATQV